MIVFAWILWVLLIIGWEYDLMIIICKTMAMAEGKNTNINVRPISFLIEVALFVFLTIYIFG